MNVPFVIVGKMLNEVPAEVFRQEYGDGVANLSGHRVKAPGEDKIPWKRL
jgi:hypothetical protein